MRAAVLKAYGQPFVVEELPDPKPGPGQAVLKVSRCGVCGSDLHMSSGHGLNFPLDTVLGHEFSGEVVEVGQGVSRLKVGDLATAMPMTGCGHCPACQANDPFRCADRVSLTAGYAEYVLVGERSAARLPAMVSLADAALTEPLACGLRGAERAALSPGARVLVIGAGAIGLAAAYWSRRLGAGKVAVSARTDRAAHIAAYMGADAFVRADADLSAAAAEALGGPPDVVFECVGAPGMFAQAVDCVRPDGTVCVLGFCTVPDSFVPSDALAKEARVVFALAYDRAAFERSLAVMDAGDVAARAMVTSTVSLDAFPAAFQALRGPTDQCKVLLDPWA